MFAEDTGISSSLMAPKKKGEGEGSVVCYGTCCAGHGVQHIIDFVHAFAGPKNPEWGRMI